MNTLKNTLEENLKQAKHYLKVYEQTNVLIDSYMERDSYKRSGENYNYEIWSDYMTTFFSNGRINLRIDNIKHYEIMNDILNYPKDTRTEKLKRALNFINKAIKNTDDSYKIVHETLNERIENKSKIYA